MNRRYSIHRKLQDPTLTALAISAVHPAARACGQDLSAEMLELRFAYKRGELKTATTAVSRCLERHRCVSGCKNMDAWTRVSALLESKDRLTNQLKLGPLLKRPCTAFIERGLAPDLAHAADRSPNCVLLTC